MTKKLFLVAIATAAFALTSCGMGASGLKDQETGTKYNLTLAATANNDTETGSKKYQRLFEQLGNKETVEYIKTLVSVDATPTNIQSKISVKEGTNGAPDATYIVDPDGIITTNAVVGLLFDMHKQKIDGVEYYDFVLIGYRPSDNGYYIERYTNITKDMFTAATNDTGFANPVLYITDSQSGFVYNNDVDATAKKASWVEEKVGKLGKDDNGKEYKDEVPLKKFTITITQAEKGKFNINVGGKDYTYEPADESAEHPDWYTKDKKLTKDVDEGGYRIGGAGYYVNAPLGTAIKANFNSDKTETKGLEEEVDE